MQKLIKKGIAFQKRKMFSEAEQQFLMASKDSATREIALLKLAQLAQAEVNYDLALLKLDEFLKVYPNNLVAQLTRAHIAGLKGSLLDYRKTVNDIVASIQNTTELTADAGEKLLIAIQYASTGMQRLDHLKTLSECIRLTIKNKKKINADILILQAEVYLALKEYDEFVETVKKANELHAENKKIFFLSKIADKYASPDYPDYTQAKVFGIGLSRTGTHSLNRALNILDYHSIHWRNPYTKNVVGDDDSPLYDGFTDVSISYRFEALYKIFPNAKFIFTTRNEQSWVKSISIHYENSRSIFSPDQLSLNDQVQRFNGALGEIEGNLYSNHTSWKNAFREFETRVRAFFSDKPKDRFLKLAITEGDGWDKLCAFLEKPLPEIPFPNANKGPAHMNHKWEQHRV